MYLVASMQFTFGMVIFAMFPSSSYISAALPKNLGSGFSAAVQKRHTRMVE